MIKIFFQFTIITCIFLAYSCTKHSGNFLHYKNQHKIIALQPLDSFDTRQLYLLRLEIEYFYDRKVIILPTLIIPMSFRVSDDGRYSADSIIKVLSGLRKDSVIEIVGLTHKDIYTVQDNTGVKDPHLAPLKDIFGLGYLPGNSCVISDFRIQSTDPARSRHRLRIVVIHEMGHNLGLPHCPDDKCIMSDQNGKISTLDQSGNDYCSLCKRKLKL